MQGGLGNQLFCYAFYLRMKAEYPYEDIRIDYDSYKYCKFHNGLRILSVFSLIYPFNIKNKYNWITSLYYRLKSKIKGFYVQKINSHSVIHEDNIEFEEFTKKYNPNKDYYFIGFWGSEFYFKPVKGLVLDVFSFNEEQMGTNVLKMAGEMASHPSTFLHIRRGDYLNSKFVALNETTYYQDALSYIESEETLTKENHYLYVFSDDIIWCKKNLSFLSEYKKVVYVNGTKDYEDLFLMSKCTHAIIANSTFSWWGAYLSNARIVCAPQYRLKGIKDRDYEILYPAEWVLI